MQRRIVLVSALAAAVQGCGGGTGDSSENSTPAAAPTPAPTPIPAPAPTPTHTPTPSPSGSIKIDIDYFPHFAGSIPPLPGIPQNTVPKFFVSPPHGIEFLGDALFYIVELLLFGFPSMVKTVPTWQWKTDIRRSYAFNVPEGFLSSPSYTCGSGTHLSEVRVTDSNGLMLSKTFELCQENDFHTTAEIVIP